MPHNFRLLPVSRRLKCLVQREPRFSRNRKLLQSAIDERLLGCAGIGIGFYFGQAVGDKEDAVDEESVGRAFDLEVAEKRVGAEQRENLVKDVVGF